MGLICSAASSFAHARGALAGFAKQYGARFRSPVAKLTDDERELPAFYDYPVEHRIRLRTTNSIESTFSTVRLRTNVTRGAGTRAAALAMTFKLIDSAEVRRRSVNAAHLVALLRAGARFGRGMLVERKALVTA
jgi:putative transposase